MYEITQHQQHNHATSSAVPSQVKRYRLNPFVTAANTTLTLIGQIKHSQNPPDVAKLRTQIINEIKHFETRLLKLEFNPRTVLAARYCLCTAVDEAVLSTAWGTQSVWVQQSLLSLFHKETYGGERFYLILENLAKDPRTNLAVVEFLYILLSLGFEGKFFAKGRMIRDEIRSRIFQRVRNTHGKVERILSPHWLDQQSLSNNLNKKSSLKRLVIICGSIFLFIWLGINISAYRKSSSSIDQMTKIARESPITAYSQLIDRPIVAHSN